MHFQNLTLANILQNLHFSAQNVTKMHKSIIFLHFLPQKIERLSQATACDGNWYQVAPNTCDDLSVPPGVLPL